MKTTLKKINKPGQYRYGHEYNDLIDKYEILYNLHIKQMQRNVALEEEIDSLNDLCSFLNTVEKSNRHHYGAV